MPTYEQKEACRSSDLLGLLMREVCLEMRN